MSGTMLNKYSYRVYGSFGYQHRGRTEPIPVPAVLWSGIPIPRVYLSGRTELTEMLDTGTEFVPNSPVWFGRVFTE